VYVAGDEQHRAHTRGVYPRPHLVDDQPGQPQPGSRVKRT
jgi:hypothetical protein